MKSQKLPGRILIVDDNRLNRLKLAHTLEQKGHRIEQAENGRLALEALHNTPFDLMLLDIVMPEMDGFQVLAAMQANHQNFTTPVIVISAQDEVENAVRCIEMGAEDYLIKPFNPIILNARISAVLEKKRLHDQEQAYLHQLQVERQRLQEYTQELQARNEELDAFGHTVAHDLKNPLGAIVGYAELVEKYYSNSMDERGRKHLIRIRQAGMKMSRIIEELLLLSGVRSQQVELKPLDMTKIVSDTLQRLDFLLETHQAEVLVPDCWPTAAGYGPWVEEIWTNYITNALKYGGQPPRVELGAIPPIDGIICFWVRDNGRGIPQADQARLFAPFERLNQTHTEGHGLGLSIVQRIGKKLGGEVGVRSETGEGSTFFFTLPEAPDVKR